MSETFQIAKNMYDLFCAGEAQVPLFWSAFLFLIIYNKDKYSKRIGIYTMLFICIFFLPITAYIIMKFCIGQGVYWRMMWLLPMNIVVAYAGVTLIMQVKNKWYRIFAAMGIVIVCITSGKYLFTEPYFTKATNSSKISDTVIDISDALDEYAKEDGTEGVRAIVTSPICIYLRQYNGSIKMAFGRDAIMNYCNSDYYNWFSDIDNMLGTMVEEAKEDNYDYLVYEVRDENWETRLADCGYVKLREIDGYGIYKLQ